MQLAPTGVWPWLMARLSFKIGSQASRYIADVAGARQSARLRVSAVLLQIDHARKQFGGVIAVNDVSFDVQAREIVALIGPNGAGKSTTFNLITGVLTSSERQASRSSAGTSTARRRRKSAKLGVSRTFQHVKLVPDMSGAGKRRDRRASARTHAGAHRPACSGSTAPMKRNCWRKRRARSRASASRDQIDATGGKPVARPAAHRRDRPRTVRRSDPAAARRARRRLAPHGEATARRHCCASCATAACRYSWWSTIWAS